MCGGGRTAAVGKGYRAGRHQHSQARTLLSSRIRKLWGLFCGPEGVLSRGGGSDFQRIWAGVCGPQAALLRSDLLPSPTRFPVQQPRYPGSWLFTCLIPGGRGPVPVPPAPSLWVLLMKFIPWGSGSPGRGQAFGTSCSYVHAPVCSS